MKDFAYLRFSALTSWRFGVILGSACWLAMMMLVAFQPFVAVGDLTRDPATIALHPPYFGALSNLGILLWSASAAVCYLSGVLLKVMQPAQRKMRAFFNFFAGLSLWLCLDDTFLLHEAILPNRLPVVHIPEAVVVASYGVALVGAIAYFRRLLQKNQPLLFGLILFLFSLSVGLDLLLPPGLFSEETVFLLEDGAKLLAIFLWLTYFVRASILFVTIPPLVSSDEKSLPALSLAPMPQPEQQLRN